MADSEMKPDNASNKIPLNQATYDQVVSYFGKIKRSVVELAMFAYDIHIQYIDDSGKKYSDDFRTWWDTFQLDAQFGSLSNFSKWQNAGRLLRATQKRNEKHFKKLPLSLDALYQVSQLKDDEFALCIENTYKRTSLTQEESEWKRSKKPKPVIFQNATGASIKRWRENWRNPRAKADRDPKRLLFAQIMIHKDFLAVDAKGQTFAAITPDQLRGYTKSISDLFAGKESSVKLVFHSETLCDKQEQKITDAEERMKEALKKKSKKSKRK